jgi:hypothetical protein
MDTNLVEFVSKVGGGSRDLRTSRRSVQGAEVLEQFPSLVGPFR